MYVFNISTPDLSDFDAPARKKDGKGQARDLNESELTIFFNALMSDKWRCVFAIAYFTGSRITEVLSLQRDDIHRDRIVIRQLKSRTEKKRTVKITSGLQPFLDAYDMPNNGYIFPAYQNSRRKTYVTIQAASKVIREVVANNPELEGISTHTFRRSLATNLYHKGHTQAEIGRFLGHTQRSVTARYIG